MNLSQRINQNLCTLLSVGISNSLERAKFTLETSEKQHMNVCFAGGNRSNLAGR